MRGRPHRPAGPPPATPAPRRRWFRVVVPLVLLAFVVSVLAVEGYTSRGFAGDQEGRGERAARSGSGVPPEVAGGGPVVDAGHDPPRTYRAPPRTVVLTFDDGPTPRGRPGSARSSTATTYPAPSSSRDGRPPATPTSSGT